jgi:hypothetical protein
MLIKLFAVALVTPLSFCGILESSEVPANGNPDCQVECGSPAPTASGLRKFSQPPKTFVVGGEEGTLLRIDDLNGKQITAEQYREDSDPRASTTYVGKSTGKIYKIGG